MNRIFNIIILVSLGLFSHGQSSNDIDITLFKPKNIKTIKTYFKSQDTIKHISNNHKLLERKIEYHKNGIIKSDLKLTFLSANPDDSLYSIYSLNPDSTIKSKKSYSTPERKWENAGTYKYKKDCKYPYQISYSKKSKITFEYDSGGRIAREKNCWKKDFTLEDYVYDSLGRLIQRTYYPEDFHTDNGWGKRHKSQSFSVFKYRYNRHADSLFCVEDEYAFTASVENWDKLRSDLPKNFNLKDTAFKVELRQNYKITVFNNRQEIIVDYNCWRNENPSYPYSKNWTRRTYVYEYY